MHYWLMKTEPETFSWQDLVRDGKTTWDGVRNYAARNHMRDMQEGDQVLIYHSVSDKEVVGIATVSRESFPDPTSIDDRWLAVEVKPLKALAHPVSLSQIKAEPLLANLMLVRQGRLSVMPLTEEEFESILRLSQKA